ncbi:MAG: ketopantoate reductase family protein [Ktedonobacteraceae bacterium]|nr:ketopantoate reductase family protein [Ktedonobacteraceae bacterium]
MNILVYGAGVIGSVYAARLQEAGYNVTILARGQRAVSLQTQGIVLEDAATGQRTTTQVSVIDHLAATDSYNVVLVAVRMDQLASVLPDIAANHQIPTVLFMLNNPAGMQRLESIEPQRVLLGFPSVGGTRQGEDIRYVLIQQQQTTMGEVNGQVTPRLEELATAFKKAGFAVTLSSDMQSWLKTHAVFVACVSAALATTEGDSIRLGHTRKSVVMMVKAIREGFKALQVQGTSIAPFNLKLIFLWMPMWFAALYWQHAFRTTIGTLAMAPHANAAHDEMRLVARDVLAQLQMSSPSIPTLSHLLALLDSPVLTGNTKN